MGDYICNYSQSSKCKGCDFYTSVALINPVCMSCKNVVVLNKKDNYIKRDLSLHRKTSCRDKMNI